MGGLDRPMATITELNALDKDIIEAELSGSPAQAASFVRTAAEAGIAEAQVSLGQMLLDGHGMPSDPVQALRWFVEAARQGDAMAINMVGRCYENGWGVAIDASRAIEWYRAAADRGLDWGMYNLATQLALRNEGGDLEAALELFRMAAALGHAKSFNMIGGFYEDGWVVDRDLEKATDHYRRAAEGGDFRGMFNYARMLIEAGRMEPASDWLRRLPEYATPAFLARARQWLEAHPAAILHKIAREYPHRLEWDKNASRKSVVPKHRQTTAP